jgi:hypothetical protein
MGNYAVASRAFALALEKTMDTEVRELLCACLERCRVFQQE